MLILLATSCGLPLNAQKHFSFFAIGDMPYHNPEDLTKFQKLIAAINSQASAFTIHVGDIKNGKTPCSDDYYKTIQNLFSEFKAPFIYTPGDNEWTDCHTPEAGGYDPAERLASLRKFYFRDGQSLGQKPMKIISQNKTPGFEKYVENSLWRKENVTFVTVHVVGSNNNFKTDGSPNDEFLERDKANLQWLTEAFKTAQTNNDAAIVIIMHGSLVYKNSESNGFNNIVEKLRTEVPAFRKPVLLVYGDLHRFVISKPLEDAADNLIDNFTSLMVYGDHDMHAIKIHVDPKSKSVFSFSEYRMEY
jgi:hypothetical protein